LEEFEISTKRAQHGWVTVDLTDIFATWLSNHEYRDGYFESPEHLEIESAVLDEFKESVVAQVREALTSPRVDDSTAVAIHGVASLFGFMKISELVSKVELAIRGRLLVLFPGEYEGNTFRFLDARDGWSYLAVPITAEEGVGKT
jgi:hypothetical protein